MIDLRHVQAFVAVVEERSFTRAAERLHIGQSGLSQQIKKLERTVGAELLHRTSRTVDITELGRELYGPAQDLLAAAAAFESRWHDHPTKRILRLAIAENGVNSLAVDALTSVRGSLFDIDLEIRRLTLRDQHLAFAHDVECALLRPPFDGALPPGIAHRAVRRDRVVVVVPVDDVEAELDPVSAAEVATWERIPLSWTPVAWGDHHPLLHDDENTTPLTMRFEAFREAYATVAISGLPCVMPESFANTYNVAGVTSRVIHDIEPMSIDLAVRTGVADPVIKHLIGAVGVDLGVPGNDRSTHRDDVAEAEPDIDVEVEVTR
ncbi:MAG: LysR family transcriptional regulator [Actinomycetota bacterium]